MLKIANEKELEAVLYPLWLSHHTAQQITGGEVVSYSELLGRVKDKEDTKTKPQRSVNEITSEFAPIIEAQRRKEAATNG